MNGFLAGLLGGMGGLGGGIQSQMQAQTQMQVLQMANSFSGNGLRQYQQDMSRFIGMRDHEVEAALRQEAYEKRQKDIERENRERPARMADERLQRMVAKFDWNRAFDLRYFDWFFAQFD